MTRDTMEQKQLQQAERRIAPQLEAIAERELVNQQRMLDIFRKHNVSAFHFQHSTGYGYDDTGREVLDRVYADVFGTEAAVVRQQFISGTHAISTALFAALRPGGRLLYATGTPYDTLNTVIGLDGSEAGTMNEWGIGCDVVPLAGGHVDMQAVHEAVTPETQVIAFQRSRGYDDRPSIGLEEMKEYMRELKAAYPSVVLFVDNCYGEFVETDEPGHIGADLMAGSLIKNPGGGITRTGGYIAGRSDLIEKAGASFAAPGIGLEGGATLGMLQEMFQGLFLAPHVVAEAHKGAVLTAALMEDAGLQASPASGEERTDLIQAVQFGDRDKMIRFCQAVQQYSPVDSGVTPQPSAMPGYSDEVIMAAGAFIQGSSIELSADGPIRPPYTAFVQGGLTYAHVKIAVSEALKAMQ